MKTVLVIIPAYNEEKNIKKVIEEVRRLAVPGIVFEQIVICDGGEDDTARIAGAMKVPVIAHPINLGAGAAIQTGLKYA
ncbi:MAG: glycosyltransferase, partial [Candidatus Margulisbacteria bacterium]|nr:glycosyltransferase [Candidatus Margulisiibacteriota bacterium]